MMNHSVFSWNSFTCRKGEIGAGTEQRGGKWDTKGSEVDSTSSNTRSSGEVRQMCGGGSGGQSWSRAH